MRSTPTSPAVRAAQAKPGRKSDGSRRTAVTRSDERSPGSFDEWQRWFSRRPLPEFHPLSPSSAVDDFPEVFVPLCLVPPAVAQEFVAETTWGEEAANPGSSELPCHGALIGTGKMAPANPRRRRGRKAAFPPLPTYRPRFRKFDDWSRWFWGAATP